jgi:hypothetical protein
VRTVPPTPPRPAAPAALSRWFHIAFLNLFLAAIIGVLLRGMFIWEIPFVRFRPWLHGHSHTALLGWLFIGTVVVLIHDGGRGALTTRLRQLLLGLQGAVLLMLVSFPLQGYGAVSITASTLHMVLAFWVLAILWRSSRSWPAAGSGRLTRWAIVLFGLSTLGVLAIGPIIATGNQGKEIYYWAVQFFLHFQFNGWFWFAAMAIGARWAERQGFKLHLDRLTLGLWIASAVLTYALAIAWSEPHPAVFATVSLAVALQVWAAVRTLSLLRRFTAPAQEQFPRWARVLVGIALVSMALKVLVQASVAVPAVAIMAFTLRHYVMGFIHMNTLGTMTMLLLAYAVVYTWCDLRQGLARTGLVLLIAGILLSELLLFAQGTFFWAGRGMIPGHYWHLFLASALMPVGVGLMLWSGWRNEQALA